MPHQRIGIHRDILELITSQEADEATPLMSRIYHRLLIAPAEWWEGKELLRVRGSTHEQASTTAWAELVNWLQVSPEEVQKALQWLNEKQVISYRTQESGREIEITFAGLSFPE